jgi:outer membrane protein assembly factor BamD (BamD/ComL family)
MGHPPLAESYASKMRQIIHVMALVVAMLCATACFNNGSRQFDAKSPDRVLFDKATVAVQERRFTVANLTLQTLVNTYPDSKYAGRARLMLQDPQVARCGGGFSTSPNLCEP